MAKKTESKADAETSKSDSPKASTTNSAKVLRFIKLRWKLLVGIVVLLLISLLAYGYINTKNQLNDLSKPDGGKTEIQQITNHVNEVLQLPNETPTLATVNDANKLKSQTFFRNTQNGDKVLIYSHAGRALLYRPSTEKVIEYSLVDFGDSN